MTKTISLLLGCIFLILGSIGAVLPLIPCVPFLLLASFFFAKSSQHLHHWFTSTKLYKDNLESFAEHKGMTKKAKVRIMSIITLIMFFGFAAMNNIPAGRLLLLIVWIFHVLIFLFGIKTLKTDINE